MTTIVTPNDLEKARHLVAQVATFDARHTERLVASIASALAKERADQVSGGIYQHYKGNFYHALTLADYTGERKLHKDGLASGFPEGEKLVVYLGCYNNPHGNRACTRPLTEWGEPVETTPEQRTILGGDPRQILRPRYVRVG
jgi:hypothetical protein